MNRTMMGLGLSFISLNLLAFPCFLTLVKDSCWTDYSVTVTITDTATMQPLLALNVPKGQSYARQEFICQPSQKLAFSAVYEPKIWASEEGLVYKAKHFLQLPSAPADKEKAWELPVCYPQAFAEVPFPPKVSGNCQCDFKSVPPVPIQL